MKVIFEVELDGPSIVIWEAGSGSRVVFRSEEEAARQLQIVQEKERAFHKAKEETGAASVICFGEYMTPYEYVRKLFRTYNTSIGKLQGITVHEALLQRPPSEFW